MIDQTHSSSSCRIPHEVPCYVFLSISLLAVGFQLLSPLMCFTRWSWLMVHTKKKKRRRSISGGKGKATEPTLKSGKKILDTCFWCHPWGEHFWKGILYASWRLLWEEISLPYKSSSPIYLLLPNPLIPAQFSKALSPIKLRILHSRNLIIQNKNGWLLSF